MFHCSLFLSFVFLRTDRRGPGWFGDAAAGGLVMQLREFRRTGAHGHAAYGLNQPGGQPENMGRHNPV